MSSGCGLLGRNGSAEELLCSRLGLQTVPLALLSDSMPERLVSNASKSNSRSQSDFQSGPSDHSSHNMNHRHHQSSKNGHSDYAADNANVESSMSCTGLDLLSPTMLLNEALCKYASMPLAETNFPDDSKLLANPKGIIKSFLPTASAMNPEKFENYRRLCLTHVKEYFKHQKGVGGAVCLVCNMLCKHWNTLQRHLQTHLDFRPFACTVCGRTFYSQSKLKRHQVIHNDVKPYKCPVCERRLGRTEHLKRHLLVHTDQKPYGCSSCSHTTKRLDGIRRHIKRKHGNESAEIVSLLSPLEAEEANARRLANAEPSEPKPKSKKKKKKKKKTSISGETSGICDLDQRDAFCGNLLDVAASFGVKDLKIPGLDASSKQLEDYQGKDGKQHQGVHSRSGGGGGDGSGGEDLKPIWDPNQMLLPSQQMQQLLYQSLVRVHPPSGNHPLSDVSSRNMTTPTMPGSSSSGARTPFPLNHNGALSHSNDAFIMNGSSVPMRYPTSASSSTAEAGGLSSSSRNAANAMLLSPGGSRANIAACYGQMDAGTEMMISQYFQSHQRFAPPVWGFANPNYHSY